MFFHGTLAYSVVEKTLDRFGLDCCTVLLAIARSWHAGQISSGKMLQSSQACGSVWMFCELCRHCLHLSTRFTMDQLRYQTDGCMPIRLPLRWERDVFDFEIGFHSLRISTGIPTSFFSAPPVPLVQTGCPRRSAPSGGENSPADCTLHIAYKICDLPLPNPLAVTTALAGYTLI